MSTRLDCITKLNPLILTIGSQLIAVPLLYFGISLLQLQMLAPCTFPIAVKLAIAMFILTVLDILIGLFLNLKGFRIISVVNTILILLMVWFGSYRLSPLGFSSGRISVLRGFVTTTFFRSNARIPSDGTITLASGSYVSFHPNTLPVQVHCLWSSAGGGALDDPQSCDTVYSPPDEVALDVLKVDIQADCGLPEAQGKIKVNILP